MTARLGTGKSVTFLYSVLSLTELVSFQDRSEVFLWLCEKSAWISRNYIFPSRDGERILRPIKANVSKLRPPFPTSPLTPPLSPPLPSNANLGEIYKHKCPSFIDTCGQHAQMHLTLKSKGLFLKYERWHEICGFEKKAFNNNCGEIKNVNTAKQFRKPFRSIVAHYFGEN